MVSCLDLGIWKLVIVWGLEIVICNSQSMLKKIIKSSASIRFKLVGIFSHIPHSIRRGRKTRLIIVIAIIAIVAPLVVNTILTRPKESLAAWYSDSWGFRKKLTIDYTKVSGDQTNFPVLVSFTDSALSKAQSDGDDILFTDSTGTGAKLDHEIEKFDQSTGTLIAWVRISNLSDSENTIIYMYYGNPSVSSQQSATGVWDSSFKAVYHLQDGADTSHVNDSKGTNTGTKQGANEPVEATGIVHKSQTFDGSNDIITVPSSSNLDLTDNFTIEGWITLGTDTPAHKYPFLSRYIDANNSYDIYQTYDAGSTVKTCLGALYRRSGTTYNQATANCVGTSQHYFSMVFSGSNIVTIYIDGSSVSNGGSTSSTVPSGSTNFMIGDRYSSGSPQVDYYWPGNLDEVRLSGTNRPDGWIATTYNTISSPSTFFSRGNEEENRVPVLLFHFDEGLGTVAYNSAIPSGAEGTLAGAIKPTWQTEDLCVSGKCLYFNGSTSSVTVANTINNVQSVSFWAKPKTSTQTLIDFDGGTHSISTSNGIISATGFSSPTIYVNGQVSKNLTANNWQHIEVTTATAFNAISIKIGNVSSNYLNGFIDEFKIYDYARTAAQVKSDYAGRGSVQGASASFGPDTTFLSQGLVGYWKMDESGPNTCTGGVNDSCDSSGNTNDGAWNGNTATESGKFGNGVTLDGTGDYIDIPDTVGGF
jgi:Concanavalin A-like lectin/glucanases superfamily/Domain of unknown function (DUF2341)